MTKLLTLRNAGRVLLGFSAGVLLGGGLALAQMMPNAGPQAMQDLDLSRTQVQQMRSLMEDYKSSFEAVLTDEQLEQLESLRVDQMSQQSGGEPQDLLAQLDLSDAQQSELDTLRDLMMAEFEDIFTAEQLEQLKTMGLLETL
ncbi:hypothetical protein VB780_28085 [Leptolyngbya sp. CCNP1308]|uniref:hypothetical protein n=1 Tax=Leptolyngbya sp. CCNP1308 TaxID=3110255 RepID=UPI002B1FEC06|nr:hypothetical protein [Leptolyngbya sp. CCNP1308]MEA5452466.1 hypothetical protein [Leptolyngbya sp. CCNP1308]